MASPYDALLDAPDVQSKPEASPYDALLANASQAKASPYDALLTVASKGNETADPELNATFDVIQAIKRGTTPSALEPTVMRDVQQGIQAEGERGAPDISKAQAFQGGLIKGVPGVGGGMAAAGALEAPNAAVAAVTGPMAPLTFAGLNILEFLGGSTIASKLAGKAQESATPYSETLQEIQKAQAEHPAYSFAGEQVPMLPMALDSLAGYAKAFNAAKTLTEGVTSVAKMAGGGATAGVAMETARPIIEAGVNKAAEIAGVSPEQVTPVTGRSLIQNALIGSLLGGAGESEAGNKLKQAIDNRETDKISKIWKSNQDVAKTQLESTPTEVLQTGYLLHKSDPDFAKSIPYNPDLIRQELERRQKTPPPETAAESSTTKPAGQANTDLKQSVDTALNEIAPNVVEPSQAVETPAVETKPASLGSDATETKTAGEPSAIAPESTDHGAAMAQDLGVKYSGEQEGANGTKLHTYSIPVGDGNESSLTVKPDVTKAELQQKIADKQAEFAVPQETAIPAETAPVVSKTQSETAGATNNAIEEHAPDESPEVKAYIAGDTQKSTGGIASKVQSILKTLGLTREDLNAVGIVPKGSGYVQTLMKVGAQMVRDISDVVNGRILPKLTKAGVMDEATQHASARQYVPALVNDLLSKVFPDKYKDNEAMSKVVKIIKKDNILGGYDEAVKERDRLRATEPADSKKLAAQEQFVKDIESAHDIAALDADVRASKGTDAESDIHRWEKHVSSLMDSLYNEIKGVDPSTPRETRGRHYEARMNLLPKSEEERMADFGDQDKPLPETNVSSYRNPNVKTDKFMRQAKLTGEYSNDPVSVLLNSFGGRWNEVSKIRFYKALESKGVAMIMDAGDPELSDVGGKPAVRMPIKFPETNPETGKTRMVEKSLYVQSHLVNEIKNVLNTDGRLTSNPIFKALTQVQLLQLADATAHTKNIHAVVVNALGSTSMGRDLLRKVPILGSVDAIKEIHDVSKQIASNSPEILAEIADMAKRGMVRPEYPSTGIQKITKMQQLIHDVDTASRVIMNRRFTNLVERGLAKDTVENRRNFVQQIGEYNRRLMSRNEAALRDYGASPFIVAGRTMNRFSRRLVTGNAGFESPTTKAAIASRAAMVSGLAFASTVPALVNMFTTGSMGGRAGTPVGAIDFGPHMDTEDGKRRGLDLFQLTGIRRGLRATGINAAIEGFKNGKSLNQIAGDSANDIVTTALHPFVGPGVGAVFQTLKGTRLDLRSGFVDTPEARKVGGIKQLLENARVALKQQNPFLYGLANKPIGMVMDAAGIPPAQDDVSAGKQMLSGLVKSPLSALGYKEYTTPALQMAGQLTNRQQYTPEQDIRYALRKNILDTMKSDPAKANQLMAKGVKDEVLTKSDIDSIRRHEKMPDVLVTRVKGLTNLEDVMSVLRVATPDERKKISPIVLSKINNSQSISNTKRADFRKELITLSRK